MLRSFSITVSSDGAVTGSIDVEPLEGQADSGELGEDLTDLLVALGEAAQEQETGVVFLFDEVQFLSKQEFEALIRALHKTTQRQLPISLVGAGLPHLPRLAGEAKSYAERLFRFRTLGPLSVPDAMMPSRSPRTNSASRSRSGPSTPWWSTPTVSVLHPGVRQGRVDRAEVPITAVEAVESQAIVEARLDESFFQVRIQRASEQETEYLRAMAELGAAPQRAADVAKVLERPSEEWARCAPASSRRASYTARCTATPPSPFLSSTGSSGGRSPLLRLEPFADHGGALKTPHGGTPGRTTSSVTSKPARA